jgi:RimJ/RimL family protein N-acetyltransferase
MKITYRPLTIDDIPIQVKWLQDPDVRRYLGPNKRNGTTIEKQQKKYKKYAEEKSGEFYIILVDSIPVGQVALTKINCAWRKKLLEKRYWQRGDAFHY